MVCNRVYGPDEVAPRSNRKYHLEALLRGSSVIYDEDWDNLCEPLPPARVEMFIRFLFDLRELITEGQRLEAVKILSEGIERAYLFTEEHKAARDLYIRYLEGD